MFKSCNGRHKLTLGYNNRLLRKMLSLSGEWQHVRENAKVPNNGGVMTRTEQLMSSGITRP